MNRRAFLSTLTGGGALGLSAASVGGQATPDAGQAQPPRLTGTRAPRAQTMYAMPAAADLATLDADVALLGVPYDLGHGAKPGTRLGPSAIREASNEVAGPVGRSDAGFYDRETGSTFLQGVRIADAGDVIAPTASVDQTLENVTTAVARIVNRNAMPVVFGGDHSITFAVLRGLKDAGRKIHILHFDAHQDFNAIVDPVSGRSIFTHGNHLRHAITLPWVSGITMLGLRGVARGAGGTANEARARGVDLISASQIIKSGSAEAVRRIPQAESYYVTIDVDVLDSSTAPGTGTPVPGGLSYYQLGELLQLVAGRGRLIGFDVTEVSPPYDVNGATAMVAAYLALRFLGDIFMHQKPNGRA